MDPTKKRQFSTDSSDQPQQPDFKKARVNRTCIFPNDIWSKVFGNLNLSELTKIKRVSIILYPIASDHCDELCKKECHKEYPLINHLYGSINVNWSNFFKSMIILKQEVEQVEAISTFDMGPAFPASRYHVLKEQFSGRGQELCILSNYLIFFDIAFPKKKEGEVAGGWIPGIGRKWSIDFPKIKFGLKCLRLARIQQNPEAMSALTHYYALKQENMGDGVPLWENESNPFVSLF
jgi:hypothetical protein